ncbi:post-segregation antitoxin CcdA [Pollutimonas nitritireducens]|uniref:Post-segregation antitoxin CcdA n=1 Tax=Pollutimonas nitritireducens TaxID=2045209 RepID=A0A2N4UF79_9BURK|nr:type II toxin-antitoxin system CcdA family antitoxin [Pollutimonas nitritireducens]PLC53664.1 post-segregation antitoxin CcdA [Pollutimonas nitritireducens]
MNAQKLHRLRSLRDGHPVHGRSSSLSRNRLRKRATNVSLPKDLLSEAKALQINISQAAEAGVVQATACTRSERWLAENQEAIESSNAFVGKYGLPLTKYRMF